MHGKPTMTQAPWKAYGSPMGDPAVPSESTINHFVVYGSPMIVVVPQERLMHQLQGVGNITALIVNSNSRKPNWRTRGSTIIQSSLLQNTDLFFKYMAYGMIQQYRTPIKLRVCLGHRSVPFPVCPLCRSRDGRACTSFEIVPL